MERIQVLISKLNDQFQQKADPAQMLVTVQLLHAELAQQQVNTRQTLGTSKVAVVLPKSPAPVFNAAEYEKYGPKPKAAQPVVAEKPVEVVEEAEADHEEKANDEDVCRSRK